MEDPVGTGPFKFVELKLNQHQLFERFKQPGDDHWWKIPDFAEVQFFYVSESATRLAMLLTGEAHISSLTTDLLLEAEAQGMSRVQSTVPGFSVFFWFLGTYYPGDPGHDPANPLLDARVRGAVNHGIDRVALKEALFPGERAQYNTVNFFENFRQHFKHDKWVPYAHDPEKSKQLLAEAGYSDGLEIEMWAPASRPGLPEAGDMAEIMATDLNNAGFDVKLNVTEVVRVYEVVKSHEKSYGGTPKIALMRYSAKPVFIHWPNSSRRNLPKGGGWTSYQDEFIEGIRTTYNNTVDPQKRLDIELQYGDHHYDEYGTVPLFWILPEAGINPNVVAEYKVDHSNFGPVRGMEWVKAVFN
jgi:peptide/nickel transport system substrate-binding protein